MNFAIFHHCLILNNSYIYIAAAYIRGLTRTRHHPAELLASGVGVDEQHLLEIDKPTRHRRTRRVQLEHQREHCPERIKEDDMSNTVYIVLKIYTH